MAAKPLDLPVFSPVAKRGGLDSAFARRALGMREARRLASIIDDAERRGLQRMAAAEADAGRLIATARAETEEMFASARAEAEALLAMLPDFAAIEAAPATHGRSAMKAIRDAADRHGLALAAVTGRVRHDRATAARAEAVKGVKAACPKLSDEEIGALFSGLAASTVKRILGGQGPASDEPCEELKGGKEE